MRGFALLMHESLRKCRLVQSVGQRVEAVKDRTGGCRGKFG